MLRVRARVRSTRYDSEDGSSDTRSQAPSKDYGLSDQAWLPKKQSYALRAKVKEVYMLQKTNAKNARVIV